MQKRKASDSDNFPEQKKQTTEKGKFVEASVDGLKPDAYKVVMDSDIRTNSLMNAETLSSSKIYEEDLMDIDKDEPVEENFKTKEDNGVTKCKDDTIHANNSQMVLESSDISVEGNLKALSSECREHPSPIRGVIHDIPSLNETCEESLIKSPENEGCFSFQAMDRTKAAEVSNNQSETLESKNGPNNVILNNEGGNPIDLESIVESQLINTSEDNGSDLVSQCMVSNDQYGTLESENDPNNVILNYECGNPIDLESIAESQLINTSDLVSQCVVSDDQYETLESENDPNNVISNIEHGNSVGLESELKSQLINTSEKNGSDLVSQAKVSDSPSETPESKDDPNNVILNHECGNSIGLESKVESQLINTFEENGSNLVGQAKVSDSQLEILESKNDPHNVILNHECGNSIGLESRVESQLINTFEENGSNLVSQAKVYDSQLEIFESKNDSQAKVYDSQLEIFESKNDPNNAISNDVNSTGIESKVESQLINTSEKNGSYLVSQGKVSDSLSEALQSKNDPNNVVSNHECENSIGFESKVESQLVNTSEKNSSDLVSQANVSDSQSEILESKNDPNNVISNHERESFVGLESKVEFQSINTSEKDESDLVSQVKVPDSQFETLESKNDPVNMTPNNEKGNSIGLESEFESQWMNISERNGSQFVSKRKLSDTDIITPRKSIASKRRKLLVLDINGLLVDIISDYHNVHRGRKKIGGKVVFKRPFCDDFIKFCFERFDIGIWSSRRSYHVENVIEYLMWKDSHELLFCWDQDHCTATGFNTLENEQKPLVLKEMKKLWNKEEKGLPWKKGYFSPSNTLLIDDSPYKALCNPPYTAIFPHPYTFDKENDNSLGPGGDLRVYLEGLYEADDVQMYVQQRPFGQPAITSEDSSWTFYSQVIEKAQGSNETQVASE